MKERSMSAYEKTFKNGYSQEGGLRPKRCSSESLKKIWHDKVSKDVQNPQEFIRINEKIDGIIDNIYAKTQSVIGWSGIRKLRIGDHRLFLYIDDEQRIIHIIGYYPRNYCYSKQKQLKITVEQLKKRNKL